MYFEDTDSGGIVYYANYLRYMERARTEWLRHNGIDVAVLARMDRIFFAVRTVELNYHLPAMLSDVLDISVTLKRLRRASIDILQEVTQDGQLICGGQLRLACLNADTLRPRRIPDSIVSRL